MKNFLKKISILIAILVSVVPFSYAVADIQTEESLSDYIFYLEFVQNKPSISTDVKTPYYIIPVAEHAPILSSGEFRGDIISGKGKLLTSFWFNNPTTTIVALGKSRAADRRIPFRDRRCPRASEVYPQYGGRCLRDRSGDSGHCG